MQEEERQPVDESRKSWGWGHWLLISVLVVISLGLIFPVFNGISEKSPQMQAANNCRQIIISLKAWASDHDGKYPEGATSNDAFRELIKGGQLEDERVFGGFFTPYVPDNDLGAAPDFAKALQKGENHWALTKGLKDDADGNCPLVFENPALPLWPPWWDPRFVNVAKPGRILKGGRIIIGRNDGSVNVEKLRMDEKPVVTLELVQDGKNLFELAGPHEVLDVAK